MYRRSLLLFLVITAVLLLLLPAAGLGEDGRSQRLCGWAAAMMDQGVSTRVDRLSLRTLAHTDVVLLSLAPTPKAPTHPLQPPVTSPLTTDTHMELRGKVHVDREAHQRLAVLVLVLELHLYMYVSGKYCVV